jgi:aminopeptidase N
VQASALRHPDLNAKVEALSAHPLFDRRNPNRLRSLYGAFAASLPAFHDASGFGYRLLADVAIEVDPFNSQVAASFGKAFKHYAHLDSKHRDLMRPELERIIAAPGVSVGLHEVVSNTLKQHSE